jgi:energy-coupling factor transporter transmembrane protein EcfT
MENAEFFHYKTQKTFLHKLPPALKILLILVLAIAAFYLPVKICLVLYPVLIILSAIFLKFQPEEIFSDQKPILAYIFLLYFAGLILNLSVHFSNLSFPVKKWEEVFTDFHKIFLPNLTYLPLLAHLALSLEITSIFYRTTSRGQFKDGFSSIEKFITRKDTAPLSDTLAVALSFIPRISTFWNRLELAWQSRGGKSSPKKAIFLFPKLFHAAMREGYEKSLAIQNRSL